MTNKEAEDVSGLLKAVRSKTKMNQFDQARNNSLKTGPDSNLEFSRLASIRIKQAQINETKAKNEQASSRSDAILRTADTE